MIDLGVLLRIIWHQLCCQRILPNLGGFLGLCTINTQTWLWLLQMLLVRKRRLFLSILTLFRAFLYSLHSVLQLRMCFGDTLMALGGCWNCAQLFGVGFHLCDYWGIGAIIFCRLRFIRICGGVKVKIALRLVPIQLDLFLFILIGMDVWGSCKETARNVMLWSQHLRLLNRKLFVGWGGSCHE